MLLPNNVLPPAVAPKLPDVSTEALIDIAVDEHKLDLELSGSGNLVAIEELKVDEIPVQTIGQEQLELDDTTAEDKVVIVDDNKPRIVKLFLKSPTLAAAYLHGDCNDTLDTLVHLLGHATDQVSITISYCSPAFNMYDVLELVGAISASKAKVDLRVVSINNAIDLLLLTTGKQITINNGLIIYPIDTFHGGGMANIEATVATAKEYQRMVYDHLSEAGLLTKEEQELLLIKASIIFITRDDLLARMPKQ
jgi:hypothetical protein